jgi:arsenate reductase (glutaredoxin)
MTGITISPNPSCGTSRNGLALIRHAGLEPRIVEYMTALPRRDGCWIASSSARSG